MDISSINQSTGSAGKSSPAFIREVENIASIAGENVKNALKRTAMQEADSWSTKKKIIIGISVAGAAVIAYKLLKSKKNA